VSDILATRIRAHVDTLCSHGHRDLGGPGNAAACAYAADILAQCGAEVLRLPFDAPAWEPGPAAIVGPDLSLPLHAGPYSPAADVTGALAVASNLSELEALDAPGCVLLLFGELASEQLTPRTYPFYSSAEHARIFDAIEAARPVAVIAATDKNPATTAALSPFPLIEDASFSVPSAYLHAEDAAPLLVLDGQTVHVTIESAVASAHCEQIVGRLVGGVSPRMIVAGHIDAKPTTPGALDNAAGCAVALAVAELLAAHPECPAVDIVPFNGEDNVTAGGELAYLGRFPVSEARLCVNIDAAGLVGADDSVSLYGLAEDRTAIVRGLLGGHEGIAEGPEWFASDHAIFAFQGVPAIAITTAGFERMQRDIAHIDKDVPGLVDEHRLADTARFVAEAVIALAT